MFHPLVTEAEASMAKVIDSLKRDLAGIRTGRASPGLVENLRVNYFGVPTPLKQLAAISVPEPRMLAIQPFDRNTLTEIERAILTSELGLVPNSDGRVVRLNIPLPTEERRRELTRVVRKRVEEGRVAIRNVRRDTLEKLRETEKAKEISQDDMKRATEALQRSTDSFIAQADEVGATKEAELLEV
ncbi:MAG: ribosome recycling factor [Chloroflexi bacterium]|nr:ribosome recycling factor [Chloroflexota bacterium]